MQRRVVITGLGVIAPNGIGKELFWNACLSGHSGIQHITHFDASSLPSQIAGEVTNFEPIALGLIPHECRNLDRHTQFALAAANLALQDAEFPEKLSLAERESIGVYIGSGVTSLTEIEKFWLQTMEQGNSALYKGCNDYQPSPPSSMFMTHAPAAAIAGHHQLYGPCMVISTACSSGTDAIGQAFWTIQRGSADYMLAGGTDAPISPIGQASCSLLGTLSTHNHPTAQASRPYDNKRDGFVMAEGAGILLLEEREAALGRNAHIYAELTAFASNNNGYHMTALPADGIPLQQLLTQALKEAHLQPEQLDYINSHGSSTRINDMIETIAYKSTFGEQAYHIPISATKSLLGHSQGAASAIETIVTALVLKHQIIPPTINLEHPDPLCDLDYVPNIARQARVKAALTHSSGFGGLNSALVLVQYDELNKQS